MFDRTDTGNGNRSGGGIWLGLALVIGLVLAVMITKVSDSALPLALLLILLFPALLMAYFDSSRLVPYILAVWVFGAEIRRISDFIVGEYHTVTVLSLAPLLVTMVVLIPIAQRRAPIQPLLRYAMIVYGLALIYGIGLGVVHNGFAAFYDLANYSVPALLVLYANARRPGLAERDAWVRSLIGITAVAALYGWVQFILAPGWDMFWIRECGMFALGKPEPLGFRVFSSLNNPSSAAMLFAAALTPMLIEKRWRGGLFGWICILLIASALAITLVRMSWLTLFVTLFVSVLFVSHVKRWQLVASLVVASLFLVFAISHMQGREAVMDRVDSMQDLQNDRSFQDRSKMLSAFLPTMLSNPFGRGMGSLGTASKIKDNGPGAQLAYIDNGYVATEMTFGILGAILFFGGLALIIVAVRKTARNWPQLQRHTTLAIAMFAGTMVGFAFGNTIPGPGGLLMWFFISLGLYMDPVPVTIKAPAPPQRALSYNLE